jgi:hypothetical protein
MRTYLRISVALFGLIALGHLLRLLFHWSAVIADRAVPGWASLIALGVSAGLSFWGLRLLREIRS